MAGLPVSFLAQPAKLRSEPSNSGSQNRRCEQWKASAPASAMGASQASISSGDAASLAAKSCPFHWERRMITGKSSPTAARTAFSTSTAKRVRADRVAPPMGSSRRLVASQKNWSIR